MLTRNFKCVAHNIEYSQISGKKRHWILLARKKLGNAGAKILIIFNVMKIEKTETYTLMLTFFNRIVIVGALAQVEQGLITNDVLPLTILKF